MSNSNNNSSNRLNVPEAREASDLGKAQMVKKICPVGRAKYERQSRTAVGHCQRVEYIASMTV